MQEQIPSSLQSAFERHAHPYYMWDGILSIPQGLEDILSQPQIQRIQNAALAMREKSPIHLIGCGTSFFAAMAIAHAFQKIARVPADASEAFEFAEYPPLDLANSALIGVSHTGGTPPVVKALDTARIQGACTVGYTDKVPSALSRSAQWIIPSQMGLEPALPKTRSYVSALMRGYLHAVELGRAKGVEVGRWVEALKGSPETSRHVLNTAEIQARDLASRWHDSRRVVIAGGGPQWATALEGALKLTEAALLNSTAWEIEEAVHGTWTSTVEEDLIIVLAIEGPSLDPAVRLAIGMKTIGARVWALTNRSWKTPQVDAITYLPEGVDEVVMPLYSILPLYQFAYFTALERKLSPDNMRLRDPRFLKARTLMRSSLT